MIHSARGFTLIELSIVLVIIGLIVGGVLVGQNLVAAAAVRAQISQIEKYNTAVNTFRGKYGYLPGDIPNPYAVQFSFATRGSYAGEGDGNGVIEGVGSNMAGSGYCPSSGEEAMFWVDLSKAGLIDGSFATASPSVVPAGNIIPSQYFPTAKLGNGGFVYVWSGGWPAVAHSLYGGPIASDAQNYFGLAALTGSYGGGDIDGLPLLTVSQAYAIDKKMDDGYPQSGGVMAIDVSGSGWAAGGPATGSPPYESNYGDYNAGTYGPVIAGGSLNDANLAQSLTCYDGNNGLPEQYSVKVNSGAGVNCVLSFRFQ